SILYPSLTCSANAPDLLSFPTRRSSDLEMRSAERRQEVVNCRFVCQVDSCQAQTPLVTVVVKQAIVADAQAATQVIQGEKLFDRSEEHTSELQSPDHLVCRLLLETKKNH